MELTMLGDKDKMPAAVEMGRRGGKARAKALTADERKAIARKAATARWKGHKKKSDTQECSDTKDIA
jgi:hypothetical protein